MRSEMFGKGMIWWQPARERLDWRALQEPEALARMIRELLDTSAPAPGPLAVAREALETLTGSLSLDRRARWEELRGLWAAHTPATVPDTQRVGIPNRLWDRLLHNLGIVPRVMERTWIRAHDRLFPRGVRSGEWSEWWGAAGAPGAAYDNRLWAWGMIEHDRVTYEGSLAALPPRLAWRAGDERWNVHPLIKRAIVETERLVMPPRLSDGPGYLLACIVDSMAELTRKNSYTGRDLAVLWGTMLLPLLGPTEVASDEGLARTDAEEPDYMQTLPFYMLHPRIRTTVVVLDQLCTLLVTDDHESLREVLALAGRPALAPSQAAGPRFTVISIYALIVEIASRALHRRAATDWDSGFGFKLFRSLLREALAEDPDEFCRRWDTRVHGDVQALALGGDMPAGALAHRLREALGTALWFPGRPAYPGGAAAQEIVDLVWLRWIDRDFLM